MTPISATMIFLNEEKHLVESVPPLLDVFDEVLLADTGSSDQSKRVLERLKSEHPNGGKLKCLDLNWRGFGATKNELQGKARHDWIFSVDADEVLTEELAQNILKLRASTLQPVQVYRINRMTNYCGGWIRHGGWFPDRHVRLFHRGKAQWSSDHVHEKLLYDNVHVFDIEGVLAHYSFSDLSDHIDRIQKYSELGSKDVLQKFGSKKVRIHDAMIRAEIRFWKMYLFKLGLLDGWRGLMIAILSGGAVFLKYMKAFEKQRRSSENGG